MNREIDSAMLERVRSATEDETLAKRLRDPGRVRIRETKYILMHAEHAAEAKASRELFRRAIEDVRPIIEGRAEELQDDSGSAYIDSYVGPSFPGSRDDFLSEAGYAFKDTENEMFIEVSVHFENNYGDGFSSGRHERGRGGGIQLDVRAYAGHPSNADESGAIPFHGIQGSGTIEVYGDEYDSEKIVDQIRKHVLEFEEQARKVTPEQVSEPHYMTITPKDGVS